VAKTNHILTAPSRGQIFSVCGHLCGQARNAKIRSAEKVSKSKKNPLETNGFKRICGGLNKA